MSKYNDLDDKEKLILFFALKHFENDLKEHPMIIQGIAETLEITDEDVKRFCEKMKINESILTVNVRWLTTILQHTLRHTQ